MNEAQTIEELCAIVEIQNGIIKRLSARLQMVSALTIEEHRRSRTQTGKYNR